MAGPAALVVAKVHKIAERLEGPDVRRHEQITKDAFDIYRLLRSIETTVMASEFGLLLSHEISSRVTSEALQKFRDLFGARSGKGAELVVQHIRGLEDSAFIAQSCVALSQDLLEATAR